MIAIVSKHKGIGRIVQYEVQIKNSRNRWSTHVFVAFGLKGTDVMANVLKDTSIVELFREDNNVKALLESATAEGQEILSYKQVWP